jgi:hypothetical protein
MAMVGFVCCAVVVLYANVRPDVVYRYLLPILYAAGFVSVAVAKQILRRFASPVATWIFEQIAQGMVFIVFPVAIQVVLVVAEFAQGSELLVGTGLGLALGLIMAIVAARYLRRSPLLLAIGLSCGLGVGLAAALGFPTAGGAISWQAGGGLWLGWGGGAGLALALALRTIPDAAVEAFLAASAKATKAPKAWGVATRLSLLLLVGLLLVGLLLYVRLRA